MVERENVGEGENEVSNGGEVQDCVFDGAVDYGETVEDDGEEEEDGDGGVEEDGDEVVEEDGDGVVEEDADDD